MINFITNNLPIYIGVLGALGVLLGISRIVKGNRKRERDYMIDGILVICMSLVCLGCGIKFSSETTKETGVVKSFTTTATVEKTAKIDGKHFTYISYGNKSLITLDDEGYYYMLNNHKGEDIELTYKADVMEDGSLDNCRLDNIEIKSQS